MKTTTDKKIEKCYCSVCRKEQSGTIVDDKNLQAILKFCCDGCEGTFQVLANEEKAYRPLVRDQFPGNIMFA